MIKITFDELEKGKWPSVTDYCRYLVSINSAAETVEVYRGDMLCLIVTDIKKAATLQPTGTDWIKYQPPESRRPNKASPEPVGEFKS